VTRDTCFLYDLRHGAIQGCVFCAWSVPRGLDLSSEVPREEQVWLEEELEDLVCDVTRVGHRHRQCVI
jgi:hypothetical protein